jgi:hypothetical protein
MKVDHVHRLLNTAEMREFMKRIIIEVKEELTVEEKNLISLAFKNVIGERRMSWRILTSIKYKEENKGTDTTRIQEYIRVIEKELHDIADEVISLCVIIIFIFFFLFCLLLSFFAVCLLFFGRL